MRYPRPLVQGGKWVVDLRAWGFGWHYMLGPDTLPAVEAIHRAWARLTELQAQKVAQPPGPQLQLLTGAPALLGSALDAWQATRRGKTEGGKDYVDEYARLVRREFGATSLPALCQPGGEALLNKYVDECIARGLSGRSIRNRMSTLGQVLRFCTREERGWLPYLPAFPELPAKTKPQYDWIGEPAFRMVRERIYEDSSESHLRAVLAREQFEEVTPALYVARRKLYLSWLFYTGARTHDADEWTADDVAIDIGVYVRHGRKTGVPLEQFDMPTPLIDDLRAYLAFVEREFFLPAERIGGGPWSTVARVLRETAVALKLTHKLNPRILRRSYAHRMFDLGYTIKDVADRMGHFDTRMLHEVYARTPRPTGRARTLWPRFTPRAGDSAPPTAKVVAFTPGAPGAKDPKQGK